MTFFDYVVDFFEVYGWRAVTFLSALTGGIILIRILTMIVRKALLRSPLENTMSGFIAAIFQFVLWLLLLFVLAAIAKIPTTPLITALGAIGLALSLAIKDSLSNLANGLVLMGTKPFKAGDFVDIDGISGTVKTIKMMQTELITPDNKKVLVPNGKITSASITNYSAKQNRRISWDIPVAYDSNLELVRKTVLKIISAHPKTLDLPIPMVVLNEKGESSLNFSARAWVLTDDYWSVYWDINEQIVLEFKSLNIKIPFNQLDVNFFDTCDGVQSAREKYDLPDERFLPIQTDLNKSGKGKNSK